MAGVIGQPDARVGELPCAYVELIKGSEVSETELIKHAEDNIGEKAAVPKYLELVGEMPKTPIGKIFKPELRKRAITRVYNESLEKAGLAARVQEVIDHPKMGLTAMVARNGVNDAKQIGKILDKFIFKWD
jgi:fatty-acyl-CoA synthase/long-chain acyl-CoA synthetase